MENTKRSFRTPILKLAILGLVIICGAIAIAQAQKERTDLNNKAANQNPQVASNDTGTLLQSATAISLPAASIPAEPTEWVRDDAIALPDQSPSPAATAQQPQFPHPSDRTTEPYIVDANVEAVQAVEPAPNRFDDPFPFDQNLPGNDVAGKGARFVNTDAADLPGGLEAPELLTSDGILPADSDAVSAVQNDSSIPSFPESEAFLNEAPDSQVADPRSPGFQNEPAFPPPDVSGNEGFGQRTPTANPIRPGSTTLAQDPLPQQPAPIANTPPVHDPAQSASSIFDGSGQLPEPSYQAPPVTMSGAGKPGALELEGPQTPSLTIHKVAPKDVRVGVPAAFTIRVRNNGQVPAENVLVRDEVPLGTQLIDTTPQATTDSSGAVLWEIGTLRPQEDVTLTMQVTPSEEGFIGSVASVTFQAQASARAEVKKPMLRIEHSAQDQVLAGETVKFTITLENPGSGEAREVVIEEDVPSGLTHAKGPRLEYEVGTIPPGGRRRLELSLTASEPGPVQNRIVARGAGGLVAQHIVDLEVVAPKLQVKIKGPARRYLERKATYVVAIENPGTADARSVELVTQLPVGLRFVGTNNSGRFDASSNTIRWSLDRLPARQFGEVKFTAEPIRKGDFNINAVATATSGLRAAQDHRVVVEGIAALLLEVADRLDPIEIGSETTYQIRVQNQGTEDANNVQFVAFIPPGMKAVSADGPTSYQIQGNQVLFESISRLPAKGESIYNVRVEGVQEGDQRFKVQMTSADTTSPVVEEESTRVYAD